MIDKERREDEVLKNCIQEAYGCSDDQLLAELDEIEAELSEEDLPGVEERIYERLMARVEEKIYCNKDVTETHKVVKAEKKVVVLKKKRQFLVAILVALFMGSIGVTTIGGNSYFLQKRYKDTGFVLNSSQNIKEIGDLQDAYEYAENVVDIPILKMNYISEGMVFEALSIVDNRVTFVFKYNGEKLYFIQSRESKEISTSINSDREEGSETITNIWLSKDIVIDEKRLDSGLVEYSATICIDDVSYRVIGKIDLNEMKNILKNLIF